MFHFRPGQRHWLPTILVLYPGRGLPGWRARWGARWGVRLSRGWPFLVMVLLLSACAAGETPPAAICDTYDRALFTTQLMGGAAVLLGLAVLGFRKNLSAILPSQGAQMGTAASSIGLGLILMAFSTEIGNQILTGFGIESLYTLCGLG